MNSRVLLSRCTRQLFVLGLNRIPMSCHVRFMGLIPVSRLSTNKLVTQQTPNLMSLRYKSKKKSKKVRNIDYNRLEFIE